MQPKTRVGATVPTFIGATGVMEQNALLQSRFMMPSWWVRAWEASSGQTAVGLGPTAQIRHAGLSPALNEMELNGLSVLLALCQQQVLRGVRSIRLDPGEHRKYLSDPGKSRSFDFERVLQLLPGLGLLRQVEGGGLRSHRIFTEDSWIRTGNMEGEGEKEAAGYQDGIQLRLGLSSLGGEAVLGFADPWEDLQRFLQGEVRAGQLLGDAPPLALWPSCWLELKGIEQVLLIRLEKAMQWDFRWMGLEGHCGVPLEDLFADVWLPRHRHKGQLLSPFFQRLKILERLGKRMVGHGILADGIQDEYLAITDREGGGPLLVWQGMHIDERDEPGKVYSGHAADWIRKNGWQNQSERLADRLLFGVDDEPLKRSWLELCGTMADEPEDSGGGLYWQNSNTPVHLLPLYYELLARNIPGHPFPLPGWLKGSSLLAGQESRASRSGFGEFSGRFFDHPEWAENLRCEPYGTLVSTVTQMDPEFSRIRERFLEKRVPSVQAPKRTPAPAAVPRRPKGQPVNSQGIRRVAGEELAWMLEHDRGRYGELKEAFLASLDDSRRKTFFEFEKRLEPRAFDDQIRQSLIKFMVENPSSWKSNKGGSGSSLVTLSPGKKKARLPGIENL